MFRLKILPGLFHGVPLLQSSSVLNPSPQCVPGVGTRTQSSVGRNSWQSSSRCQPNRPPFCLHPLRGCAVPSTPAKVFQSMKKGMNHPEILGMTMWKKTKPVPQFLPISPHLVHLPNVVAVLRKDPKAYGHDTPWAKVHEVQVGVVQGRPVAGCPAVHI